MYYLELVSLSIPLVLCSKFHDTNKHPDILVKKKKKEKEIQLLIPWFPGSAYAGLILGALYLVCGILFFTGIWSVQIFYGLG